MEADNERWSGILLGSGKNFRNFSYVQPSILQQNTHTGVTGSAQAIFFLCLGDGKGKTVKKQIQIPTHALADKQRLSGVTQLAPTFIFSAPTPFSPVVDRHP
jgi:hypothetical protein